MRRCLQQILIRLSRRRRFLRLRFRRLLSGLGLHRTRLLLRLLIRLFRHARLRTRLLHWLRLRPLLLLLLLHLLLNLALTLQGLLALLRRLFIPRHFVQLSWLLAHVGLHLGQQLALFVGQLIGVFHFATGGRPSGRTHTRLTALQLFDIAPALFRFWRQTIAYDLVALKGFSIFFLVVSNKVQTTDEGHQNGGSNRDHCWRDRGQATLLAP